MADPLYDGVSVGDLVVTAIARGGERTAFIGDHRQYSYRELGARISQVVQVLEARGLRRGDAVATLSGNRPEAFLITAAAYLMGLRLTWMNPTSSEDDHAYILRGFGRGHALRRPGPVRRAGAHAGAARAGTAAADVLRRQRRRGRRPARRQRCLRARPAGGRGRGRRRVRAGLHRRHDRPAEGRGAHAPSARDHDPDRDGRLGLAARPSLPGADADHPRLGRDDHAGAAEERHLCDDAGLHAGEVRAPGAGRTASPPPSWCRR